MQYFWFCFLIFVQSFLLSCFCISLPVIRSPMVMGLEYCESACEYIGNWTVCGLYIFVLNTFILTTNWIIIIIITFTINGAYVIDNSIFYSMLHDPVESQRGHGCLSVVSVVCCQLEVSVTSWSLVQSSPHDCGVSLCVI